MSSLEHFKLATCLPLQREDSVLLGVNQMLEDRTRVMRSLRLELPSKLRPSIDVVIGDGRYRIQLIMGDCTLTSTVGAAAATQLAQDQFKVKQVTYLNVGGPPYEDYFDIVYENATFSVRPKRNTPIYLLPETYNLPPLEVQKQCLGGRLFYSGKAKKIGIRSFTELCTAASNQANYFSWKSPAGKP